MNDHAKAADTKQRVDDLAVAWSLKIILLAAVIVVVSTLYPFKFSLTGISPLDAITENFNSSSSYLDVAANIILFMPLGFGLGSAFAKRPYAFTTKLIITIVISSAFSFMIETLQVFLPGRKATPMDVVSNAMGGGVGFLCFYFLGTFIYLTAVTIAQRSRSRIAKVSLKYLVIALSLYIVLASLLVASWQGSSLKGWYDGFPLTLGNHDSVYHPPSQGAGSPVWAGSVADLVFLDRALSRSQIDAFFSEVQSFPPRDDSVVAAYSLRGPQGNEDLIGRSPKLIWQGKPIEMSDRVGSSLSAEHWLKTLEPLKFVTNRIRTASQLTVSALITPGDISNLAPHAQQIISIANPNGSGNLTLAQVQSNLSLGITLRRINRSADYYTQLVLNVFEDQKSHRVVATYSGFVLRVYVDGVEGAAVFDLTPNRFQIMLYLLVLVPFAFLLALIAKRIQRNVWLYLLVVGGGTVLPALLLEGFLASEGDRKIRLANLLMGIVIVGGTILAIKGNFKRPRQFAVSSH